MTSAAADASGEVWLRGNLRPLLGLATLAATIGAGLAAAVLFSDASPAACWMTAALLAMAAVVITGLALAAARPRLERAGDFLRVRLSPTQVHELPLEIVECFFLGSNSLEPQGAAPRDDVVTHRVGTLVVRLAERAVAYRERPTFGPWGTWREGSIVCDGRWCEPLSAELARRLSGRLIEAKRSAAARRAEGPA
jgi:hypothetical protein